jgi:ligand-binding SRPBCC domain-containing protein
MPTIILHTPIQAPATRCFDLSLSIDLHMKSTAGTHEQAIAGVTSGLIGLHETVTWKARHLGKYRTLSTRITHLGRPFLFIDEMTEGDFLYMRHEHHFTEHDGTTVLKDVFAFEAPYGLIGKLFSRLFLRSYMKGFLLERNRLIKKVAESEEWKVFLK